MADCEEKEEADLGTLEDLFPEKEEDKVFRAKSPLHTRRFGHSDSDLDHRIIVEKIRKQVPKVPDDDKNHIDGTVDLEFREKPQPSIHDQSPSKKRGFGAVAIVDFDENIANSSSFAVSNVHSFADALRALSPEISRVKPRGGMKMRNSSVVPDNGPEMTDGGLPEPRQRAKSAMTRAVNFEEDLQSQSSSNSHGPQALRRWKEEAERLRQENELLKKKAATVAAATAAALNAKSSSSKASSKRATSPYGGTKSSKRTTSPYGGGHTSCDEYSEVEPTIVSDSTDKQKKKRPLKPQKGPLLPQTGPLLPARQARMVHVPHNHAMQPLQGQGHGLNPQAPIVTNNAAPPSHAHPMQYSSQYTTDDGTKVIYLPKLLWEGGFLWKIPFNGRGAPERRFVAIKRAAHASIYARAISVSKNGVADGSVANGVTGYMCYPPTLIWHDCDKSGREIKNAREMALVEGAHVVAGHNTPAFWKLASRDGPMPRPELCFSVVCSARTLDLAAEGHNICESWKRGLLGMLIALSPDQASQLLSAAGGDGLLSNNTNGAPHVQSTPNYPPPPHDMGYDPSYDPNGHVPHYPPPAHNPYPNNGYGNQGNDAYSYAPPPPAVGAPTGPNSYYHPPPAPPSHPSANANHHQNNLQQQQQQQKQLQQQQYGQVEGHKEALRKQMFDAAKSGDYHGLEMALKAGVPCNLMEPKTADTPLLIVCRGGNPDLVRLCLNFGAKNDPHPDFGHTALHTAVSESQYDASVVLLQAAAASQADAVICNLTDPKGQTPLHIAATKGHIALFDLLLEHGADIFRVDDLNQTVLHLCASGGSTDCLSLVLDLEGDSLLEEIDSNGNTALHHASLHGHLACVRLLLETAASVVVRNHRGQSPYNLAKLRGHHQVGMLLMDYQGGLMLILLCSNSPLSNEHIYHTYHILLLRNHFTQSFYPIHLHNPPTPPSHTTLSYNPFTNPCFRQSSGVTAATR